MRMKIFLCGFLISALSFLQCHGASSRWNNVAYKNNKYLQIFEQYMNRTINPCDDFYGYACDKWPKLHKKGLSILDELNDEVNVPLLEFIKNYKPVDNRHNLYDKVWNYHTACLADKTASYIEYLKYADELDWPLLSRHITESAFQNFNNKPNWFLKLAKLNRYGVNILIEHMVDRSKDNPYEYFIGFDKPKTESFNTFDKHDSNLITILQNIGIKQGFAVAVNEEVYEFEKKLKNIAIKSTDYEERNLTGDYIPKYLPWTKYIQTLLGYKVCDSFRFNIRNWNYFENLTQLIQNTPPQVVYNYVLIKFMLGAIDDSPRNQPLACINDMRRHMEPAMNFIYDTTVYRPHAAAYNADVQRIFESIRETLSNRLDLNENNLTDDEIQNLQKKLHSMNLIMNNLPSNVDLEFLEDYYKDLQLDSTSFYKNHLATMKFRFAKEFSQLFYPVQERKKYFVMGNHKMVGKCSLFYKYNENSIVVPYCLLQSPMYEFELYDVYKFSMFGFLLAHEMLHAFDYFAIDYDFEGKPNIVSSSVPFRVSNCIIDHPIDRYQERYVDQIAMRTVYDVIFPENMENNIQYFENRETMERQFFVHFAHFFCGDLRYTPGSEDVRDYRLHLVTGNFEPFIRNFQCDVEKDGYTSKACF